MIITQNQIQLRDRVCQSLHRACLFVCLLLFKQIGPPRNERPAGVGDATFVIWPSESNICDSSLD